MNNPIDPINDIAQKHFGIEYVFPFQRLVISNILRAAGSGEFEIDPSFEDELTPHQIVLLPTGAGKSLCFMIPAFFLKGITLVIFPLLSLLSDQQRRTEEACLQSVILRGGQSSGERDEIFRQCRDGEVKMILSNPETLLKDEILNTIGTLNISHLVVDETHTVSEWGDSFRPAYLELDKIISAIGVQLITAFTATASEHILERIKEIVFPGNTPNIVYGNPDRGNISYHVIRSVNPMRTLTELTGEVDKPLIVFSSTRTGTELTARILRKHLQSENIYFYHAGLHKEEKETVEKWFFTSENGILVATCAYGMGIDKKSIRTVIHIDPPSTVESYLQESGRAGRDRAPAKAILIFNPLTKRKLSSIKDPLVKKRFYSMISYAENDRDCRRETLLSLLDSTPEVCNGCDVCEDSIIRESYKTEILMIIKRNQRKFTKIDFIYFLKGFSNREIRSHHLDSINGFAILSHWSTDSIREIIQNLITLGELRIPESGFWKNYLSCRRSRLSHMYMDSIRLVKKKAERLKMPHKLS